MNQSLFDEQKQLWQQGLRATVETLLLRHPDVTTNRATVWNLIEQEIALHSEAGVTLQAAEYVARFPDFQQQLRQLWPSQLEQQSNQTAASFETIVPSATVRQRDPSPAIPPPASQPTALVLETIREQAAPPATVPDDLYRTIAASKVDPQATIQGLGTVVGKQTEAVAADLKAVFEGRPNIPGFQIISELGRGGMGVVYQARQLSANRLVALKVVRNDLLDTLPETTKASTIERFRFEAQAAAQLEHDNLVPVYEVGETGILRYYAMRYVVGKSLFDLLRDGPLDNKLAAKYLEPIARGLHYAHEHGILHRDLKPHNIMLDQTLDRPLLTDFGLAKFTDQSIELTQAGEVMGTPAYMSPEQARDAGKVTALADVYSMGATLYHLLAGRPPFQAANIADTIRQIIFEEPVSPRVLNPAINIDLETICLRCLQKETSKRYASAAELADDLRRYLHGEPIQARPIGRLERWWRWCRRNPTLAGVSATAASLAAIALLSIVIGYRNTSAALASSEKRLQMALQVVDEFFTRLSEDELLNEPGMQPLRKDLLARALKHYQLFLHESGGNPAIQDEVAAARFRVGMITQLTESPARAIAELTVARQLQEQLLRADPDNIARIKALADTLNALAGLAKITKQLDQASELFKQSEQLRERLVQMQPQQSDYGRLLANAKMNVALVEVARSQFANARQHLEQAQTLRQQLLRKSSSDLKIQRDLAMGYYNLADLDLREQNESLAINDLNLAITEFQKLLKLDNRSLSIRYYLGVSQRLLGGLLASSNQLSTAQKQYEAARELMVALAQGNPDVPQYQSELAILAMNLGELYFDQQNLTAEQQAWLLAKTTLHDLLDKHPKNSDYRRDYATSMSALGNVQLRLGELASATEASQSACQQFQELLALDPNDESLQQQLKEAQADLEKIKTAQTAKEIK